MRGTGGGSSWGEEGECRIPWTPAASHRHEHAQVRHTEQLAWGRGRTLNPDRVRFSFVLLSLLPYYKAWAIYFPRGRILPLRVHTHAYTTVRCRTRILGFCSRCRNAPESRCWVRDTSPAEELACPQASADGNLFCRTYQSSQVVESAGK